MFDVNIKLIAASAKSIQHFRTYTLEVHGAMGLTQEDWMLLTSPFPWTARQRPVATAALQKLFDGTLAEAGLPPMTIICEYAAPVIAQTVQPVNWQVAARSCKTVVAAHDLILSTNPDEPLPTARAERLFLTILSADEVVENAHTDQPDILQSEIPQDETQKSKTSKKQKP